MKYFMHSPGSYLFMKSIGYTSCGHKSPSACATQHTSSLSSMLRLGLGLGSVNPQPPSASKMGRHKQAGIMFPSFQQDAINDFLSDCASIHCMGSSQVF